MKKWDNGVVSMEVTSCMSCPEKKQIMARRKISGQWVTALRGVICKRTGMAVRMMGIAASCPLPDFEPEEDATQVADALVEVQSAVNNGDSGEAERSALNSNEEGQDDDQ